MSSPGYQEGVLTLSRSEPKNVFFSRRVNLVLGSQLVESYLYSRIVADLFKVVLPLDDVFLLFAHFQFLLYMLIDVFNVELAGGSFYHDPFLVADVELVHEVSWKIYVDRLICTLKTLALTITTSGFIILTLYVNFLEVLLLMYRV